MASGRCPGPESATSLDVSRFLGRDHFAACNSTAPIEVSSGNRTIHRLSRDGNRRLNYVIHMAAVAQIRRRHSDGRAYYDASSPRAGLLSGWVAACGAGTISRVRIQVTLADVPIPSFTARPGAARAGAYLTIRNLSGSADELTGASSPAARLVLSSLPHRG